MKTTDAELKREDRIARAIAAYVRAYAAEEARDAETVRFFAERVAHTIERGDWRQEGCRKGADVRLLKIKRRCPGSGVDRPDWSLTFAPRGKVLELTTTCIVCSQLVKATGTRVSKAWTVPEHGEIVEGEPVLDLTEDLNE